MSQSPAKYHNLNRPDEVTDATSYKKHTSKKLSIMPRFLEAKLVLTKIKELMTKWKKATFKEKLIVSTVTGFLLFLIVLAVCFVSIFTDKEGRCTQ